ncbi:MAG: hypothetical protein WAW36_14365 [Methylovulum miyakonense]|nr:hypothetical protein [Methylovulum miyakonense]
MTKLERIDLAQAANLENAIEAVCDNMAADDYKLVSSFVYQNQLVLIFQK